MLRNRFPCRHLFRAGALVLLMLACGLTVAPPAAAANGTIRVVTVDANGARIKGACFEVDYVSICDAATSSGLNGITTLSMPAGSYTLNVRRVPPGYQLPSAPQVTIVAGQQTTANVVLKRGASTFRLSTLDQETGTAIGNACYQVENSAVRYIACDSADGAVDGVIAFGGMKNTTYAVRLTERQPAGYYPDVSLKYITFTAAGSTKSQLWTLVKAPQSATVTISLKTLRGTTFVTGGCYTLIQSPGILLSTVCDGDDGTLDGHTTLWARPAYYQITLRNSVALGVYTTSVTSFKKLDGQALSITVNVRYLIDL